MPTPHSLHKRSRKGQIENIVWTLIWFAAFALIFFSLQYYLSRMASDTKFERVKTAQDLALTASASYIPSSNFDLTMPPFAYTTSFSPGRVTVQHLDPSRGLIKEQAMYPAHDAISLHAAIFPQGVNTPGIYKLVKDGNDISIPTKQGPGIAPLLRLTCPAVILPQRIVLDPGHGGGSKSGDSGSVFGALQESSITTAITNELFAQLSSSGHTPSITRPDNSAISASSRMERIPHDAALISIHAHPSIIPGKATVTAIIPDQSIHSPIHHSRSLGLACGLVNALLATGKSGITSFTNITSITTFSGGNILSINPERLGPERLSAGEDIHTLEGLYVLGREGSSVVLILNGIDLPPEASPFTSPSQIGRSLGMLFATPYDGEAP